LLETVERKTALSSLALDSPRGRVKVKEAVARS